MTATVSDRDERTNERTMIMDNVRNEEGRSCPCSSLVDRLEDTDIKHMFRFLLEPFQSAAHSVPTPGCDDIRSMLGCRRGPLRVVWPCCPKVWA